MLPYPESVSVVDKVYRPTTLSCFSFLLNKGKITEYFHPTNRSKESFLGRPVGIFMVAFNFLIFFNFTLHDSVYKIAKLMDTSLPGAIITVKSIFKSLCLVLFLATEQKSLLACCAASQNYLFWSKGRQEKWPSL
jgi:hypothetical protein